MRHRVIPTVLITALASASDLAAQAQEQAEISTDKQVFSYALGLRIGQNLQQQGVEKVDGRALAAGIEDVLAGADLRVPADELQAAVQAYQQQLIAERAETAEKNEQAGREFLASNKQKEGVVERESGLQYRVLREGSGKSPSKDDSVLVHYRGKLVNGEEFDSSYARGEPARVKIDKAIDGWQEALPLMQEGDKWRIFLPPKLAYGARGAGEIIGPNETLIFDVELIEVRESEAQEGEDPAGS